MAEKKVDSGKKKRKKHPKIKKGMLYKVEGNTLTRLRKFDPKAGPGVFMAEHAKRRHSGKTGYTEFK